jgi:hypothetical protein
LVVEKPGFKSVRRNVAVPGSFMSATFNVDLVSEGWVAADDALVVTLNWDQMPADLDIGVYFMANSTYACNVSFGAARECGGARLASATHTGGTHGGEAVELTVAPSVYMFYASYISSEDGGAVGIIDSRAIISVYSAASNDALVNLDLPHTSVAVPTTWLAFCMDGRAGVSSIIPLHQLATFTSTNATSVAEAEGYWEK